jgi:hypothetical protein
MPLRVLLICLTLSAAACTAPQPAQSGPAIIGDAGSAAAGLAYAQDACADCHAVLPGEQMSPHPDAPAFATIVETPGMSGLALNVWLRSDHEQMPHLIVDPDHVEDLWAYMSTLQQSEQGNR